MKILDTFWHRWLKQPYRLAVKDTGDQSDETVVLLHGVAASGKVWQTLASLLNKNHRVIVPDLLGFGSSPKPQWDDYSVQDHAAAVLKTLKKFNVKKPITLVGHSMGCLVATHIAATQPEWIKRLVLYEPPLYADDPDFRSHMRRREQYFALYEFIANHPQLAVAEAEMLWRVAKKIVGLKLTKEQWIPFERSLRNTIMKQTAYTELHHIKVPTDIIHGRFDLIVTRTDLRKMYKNNKHITWHTVTDVHGISARSARYIANLLLTSA